MAEEEKAPEEKGAEGEAAEAPKRKFSLLHIMLFGQFGLLLLAGAVIIKVSLFTPKPDLSRKSMQERAIASVRDTLNEIQNVDMDKFTVNLADKHTLKVGIQIEVSNAATASLLKKRLPAVRASMLHVLSQFQGQKAERMQGKLLLKEALRSALNEEIEQALGSSKKDIPGVVREVYFVDFVMI